MADKKIKSVIVPTVALTVICAVISLALGFTNHITKDAIKNAELKEARESMATIYTAEDATFNTVTIADIEYTEVSENGKLAGYIFTTSENGYGGAVKVMTGINTDGTVKAIRVLSVDDETPGLGQNAKADTDFAKQFDGKKGEISTEKNKEIDALTGATITTNAVIRNVNTALKQFETVKGAK